jgi:hypothetical protein
VVVPKKTYLPWSPCLCTMRAAKMRTASSSLRKPERVQISPMNEPRPILSTFNGTSQKLLALLQAVRCLAHSTGRIDKAGARPDALIGIRIVRGAARQIDLSHLYETDRTENSRASYNVKYKIGLLLKQTS